MDIGSKKGFWKKEYILPYSGKKNYQKDFFETFKNREDYIPLCLLNLCADGIRKLDDTRKINNISSLLERNITRDMLYHKEDIIFLYEKYINKPLDLTIYHSYNQDKSSSERIVLGSQYPKIEFSYIINTSTSFYKYYTDHFFCSVISPRRILTEGWYTDTIPLYSLMVKKEFVPYVRACAILDIPVNKEVLELWVDSKLSNVGSKIPIRPYYNKYIKKICLNNGINIKVFDNLKGELINVFKKKTFKSIKEEKNYFSNIIDRAIKEELEDRGIVSETELDKAIENILSFKLNYE